MTGKTSSKKPATKSPSKRKPVARRPRRPKDLAHGRWLGDFPGLGAAEKAMVACCARGEKWSPKNWDGKRPTKATSANKIRGELIRYLMLGGDAQNPVHEIGVSLSGGWIAGSVDLELVRTDKDLDLRKCHFENQISAMNARIAGIYLNGSSVPGLNAQGIEVKGDVFLRDDFKATGEVSLSGATVGGQLSCTNGSFSNPDGKALNAQNIEVKGGVFLSDDFKATGEVSLSGATVGGQLSCINGSFSNPDGEALNAQGIEVKGDVFLRDDFKTTGEVSLSGATVGGQLSCTNGSFSNPDGNALNVQNIEVKGGVFLSDDFKATGEVSLSGATVGGQLSCTNGSFSNPDGKALNAQGIEVKGDVFLRDDFKATGEVSLSGATVGGQLSCTNGSFSNPDGKALNAQGIEVKGGVFLSDDFKATGEVSLSGATVGGQLSCINGSFSNPDGEALNAEGLDVDRQFFFSPTQFEGELTLMSASVDDLADDLSTWPKQNYFLNGFQYQRLHGNLSASARIDWLKNQAASELSNNFAPQPWEQLAKVLRETGHSDEAAEVAIAKQDALRKAGRIGQREVKQFEEKKLRKFRSAIDSLWNPVSIFLSRSWHWIYGALSGYGYRPSRILYLLFALIFLSSIAYYEGRHDGLIGPNNPLVNMSENTAICGNGGDSGMIYWTDPECPVPPEYSTFQPFLYALDVTLPLVDLHQEADWGPVVVNKKGEVLWGGRLLRWLMWLNIMLGWVASLMFVAIVSRLVDKD